ncbi:MAG: PQQ-dependent sugar dehydrogenase, partial [Cyanobacteria bacterium J06576_12]
EINAGEAGSNFGWPFYEGGNDESIPTRSYENLPEAQAFYNSNPDVTSAFLGINRSTDGINAIVMGDVYTGDVYPDRYKGDLFFGDLGQGIIRNINLDSNGEVSSIETFANEDPFIVQMVQGPDDLLYHVNLVNGTVSRWVFE